MSELKKSYRLELILLGLLLIVSFFTFKNGLNHGFTFLDDQVQISENQNIRILNWESIKAIFSSTSVGMYQPISTLFYAITYQLAGLNPFAYHLLSLIFHLVNGVLVYSLLKKLNFKASTSLLLSAIFLLHPMQVESVSWASAFSTLCFSLFYLLSLISYLKYLEKGKTQLYLLSIFLFILSCLSKSTAVTLGLLLLVFDYWKAKQWKWKYLLNKIPYLLIAIVIGLLTIQSRESAGHLSDLSISFSLFERIFLVSYASLFYPISFLVPLKLSAFYPYPEIQDSLLPWPYYLSLAVLFLVGFLIYRQRQRIYLLMGGLFYLISISIMLQIIPVGNQLTTDRYIYLPIIGLLIILGNWVSKVPAKRMWFATAIIAFTLATQTTRRVSVWENDKLIWTDVLEKFPKVAQAHNNLGSYAMKEGDLKTALNHFNQAVKFKPYYADAFSNRGNVLSQMGNSEKALSDFNQAIKLRPHADAYLNRANLYASNKMFDQALVDYQASLDLKPAADVYTNRAFVLLQIGQKNQAIQDLNTAIKLNPNFSQAYFLRGMVFQQAEDINKACQDFKRASQLGDAKAIKAANRFCN